MSLYLDAYVKGARNVESLGLYIVPERTATDRRLNMETKVDAVNRISEYFAKLPTKR